MPKKSETERKKKIRRIKKSQTSKKITSEEFDEKVIDLAKKGFTSEKIGEELRNQGIHSKEHNKKISQILKKKNLYINPDKKNIEEQLERIKNHYEKNKQDKKAMREKDRIFSQLRNLKAYCDKEK